MAAVFDMHGDSAHHIRMQYNRSALDIEVPIPLVAKSVVQFLDWLAVKRDHAPYEATEILFPIAEVEGQTVGCVILFFRRSSGGRPVAVRP